MDWKEQVEKKNRLTMPVPKKHHRSFSRIFSNSRLNISRYNPTTRKAVSIRSTVISSACNP